MSQGGKAWRETLKISTHSRNSEECSQPCFKGANPQTQELSWAKGVSQSTTHGRRVRGCPFRTAQLRVLACTVYRWAAPGPLSSRLQVQEGRGVYTLFSLTVFMSVLIETSHVLPKCNGPYFSLRYVFKAPGTSSNNWLRNEQIHWSCKHYYRLQC